MKKALRYVLPGLIFLVSLGIHGQQYPLLKTIDSLIATDDFKIAQDVIRKNGQARAPMGLNIGRLVYPLAKSEYLSDKNTPFPLAMALMDDVTSAENQPDSVKYEAYLGLGLGLVDQGNVARSEKYLLQANELANSMEDIKRMVASEFHLGELGLKLGDIGRLIDRTDRALGLMQEHPEVTFRMAPRILNYKGSLMHFMGKPDSANYFFDRAIRNIDPVNTDPEHLYYLPGTIYGNWTMVKQSAGAYDAAMQLTLKSIASFNAFLKGTNNHPLTEKVHGNLSIAYRNLGSLYNDLGNKERAVQVATMGYHHAKENFLPNTVQYFSAILMMGEAHLYAAYRDKARKYLEEAETSLISIPGENWSYTANLYSTMGDLEKMEGNFALAIDHYRHCLNAYTKSNPDEFSQNVVFARLNLAQTYASDRQFDKGLALLEDTLSRIESTQGKDSYLGKMAQITQIRIYDLKGDDEEVGKLCQMLLQAYTDAPESSNAAYLWGEQTELLTYLAKAKFARRAQHEQYLQEAADIIDNATTLVERRKSLVTSQQGVSDLIESNRATFDLAKQIYLALYQKTENKEYLEKVVELHESSIYNRIRARLNLTDNSIVPKDILKRERELRREINTFFDPGENVINISTWDSLMTSWQDHLEDVRKRHPAYYRMRYASIVEPLKNLYKDIPKQTAVVRYLTVGEDRYVYVVTGGKRHLLPVGTDVSDCISRISDFKGAEDELFDCLYQLYRELWAPIEDLVSTLDIVVVPDGDLFNLSFELLTPERIGSLSQLATGSLLTKHNLSYNYSLFNLQGKEEILGIEEDFVAFVPEFDEDMKNEYRLAVRDSVFLDRTYLTLLPQPFSTELVKKFSGRLDGRSFLNERASKQLFKAHAREHKIIHIGTHAESNNLSPELSRLVFAKNVSDSLDMDNNYLYTYEIYDQNLSSELAILTACETGRPSYQPGEGMISLAHAFNYAGSASVLTSLWQIDEKSSNELLDGFYEYLLMGKPKNEALRLAKLDYLRSSEGRVLHPQYWAGLVLMGDVSPVELSAENNYRTWILAMMAGLFLIMVTAIFLKRKAP
ncbi:CHAT domain-containing protein [Flagellimonas oceanensis]|uniref:CHAT domain-containing protein n=1 Tax=Flagellimonas oceanensis TaxID=2499163 RepID=UPI000F8E428E|nr:CHAT domain-containing tetratricopeptide repeat protein [Allomuricauda oceanensis]